MRKLLLFLVFFLWASSAVPDVHGRVHLDSKDLFFGYAGVGVLGFRPEYGVKVINSGSDVVKVEKVFVRGPNAGEFRITHDGCTGKDIYPGGFCEIKVSLEPEEVGDKEAYLILKLSDGGALVCKLWGFADMPADFGGGGSVGP